MTDNIEQKLKQIKSLEGKIKSFVDDFFKEKSSYYTDCFIFAIVDRHLKNSRGFRELVLSKNGLCAGTIVRCMIDSLARLNALYLCRGNEIKFIYHFLDSSTKFSHFVDNNRKKLRDYYLISKLKEKYSDIKDLIEKDYNEFCGIAHLSDSHFKSSCNKITKIDNLIEFELIISSSDLNINSQSYANIADACLRYSEILKKEIESYFENRENFSHLISSNSEFIKTLNDIKKDNAKRQKLILKK